MGPELMVLMMYSKLYLSIPTDRGGEFGALLVVRSIKTIDP